MKVDYAIGFLKDWNNLYEQEISHLQKFQPGWLETEGFLMRFTLLGN